MTTHTDTTEFRGAQFVDIDMSGSVFREVDLSEAQMHGVRSWAPISMAPSRACA